MYSRYLTKHKKQIKSHSRNQINEVETDIWMWHLLLFLSSLWLAEFLLYTYDNKHCSTENPLWWNMENDVYKAIVFSFNPFSNIIHEMGQTEEKQKIDATENLRHFKRISESVFWKVNRGIRCRESCVLALVLISGDLKDMYVSEKRNSTL